MFAYLLQTLYELREPLISLKEWILSHSILFNYFFLFIKLEWITKKYFFKVLVM